MERVDVVDVDDKELYAVTKTEAHDKGLLHRTVIAEVRTKDKKWLLVRQAGDKQDAGQFVSPVGGHVSAGETEDAALKRETLEELGLRDFNFRLIGKAIYNRKTRGKQENHLFILYEIYSDHKPELNEESVKYRYFTEEEIRNEFKSMSSLLGDPFHFVVKKFYPQLLAK